MIRSIVAASIRSRFFMVALAAVIILAGFIQLRDMKVDALPEFEPPFVEIQTEALGLSAEEVESFITHPLEADFLNGVAWLDSIHSESVAGLSSITLLFEPGTDLIRARQMVQERLVQAQALPRVSKPPTLLQPLSATSRVLMIGLSSEELSLIDLSVLARWTVRPRLMGVPGVANVAIWGERDWQLQVQVDPARLQENDISLQQVIETAGNAVWVSPLSFLNASTPGTGGWIDTPNQRLGIMHILPITSPESMSQVPVVDADGVQLGDVTDVVVSHQPLIGDAFLRNGPGLLLVIEKFRGANTQEVTQGLEEALEALRPGLPGVEIDAAIYRPATFVDLAIQNLGQAMLLGGALVVVVLLLLLRSLRTALVSIVSILLSLMAAVLVLSLRGMTINAMILAGLLIAIGVIVDDAVVDVENVKRRLRQYRQEHGEQAPMSVIVDALFKMRTAMIYAALIAILPVLPVLLLPGIDGAFIQPLVLAYVLAVLISMLVALFATPALSYLLLSNQPIQPRAASVGGLQRRYEQLLAAIVQVPSVVYAAVIIAVIAGIVVLPAMGQEMLPELKETDLLIQWQAEPGISHPAVSEIASRATSELQAIPGVRNVAAHVGRSILSDQIVNIHSGQFWVSLDPAADRNATTAAIQTAMEAYPELNRNVTTYLNEQSSGVFTGGSDALVVRVYGTELDVLGAQAEAVRQRISAIDGVAGPEVELQPEEPQMEIEVNLDAAERYGLKPGDVRRAAATLLSGIQVGSLFEEQKVFEVVVWGSPATRESVDRVGELLIDTPTGEAVPLGEVADIRLTTVPTVIRHESVSRYLDVSANVVGRDFNAVVNDVRTALHELEFPLEYHAEVLGGYAERQAAVQQIAGVTVVAAIMIFLLLQACYESWRRAVVSFLSLPVALVGGVLAVFIAGGGVLSLGSLVGLLTILGITARNGILMIRHYQELEQEGRTSSAALIVRASGERAAAIITTALTTVAVLLPVVIRGAIPGLEIVHPMAIAILGGLITSTLVNLFALPVLYLRFGSSPAPVTPGLQPPDTSGLQFEPSAD